MKRTTVRLDDHLLLQAKRHAAESGCTLTRFIEEALREKISRKKPGKPRRLVKLTTAGGHGLRPGIDLDDSAGLRDVMDDSHAVP